jgi:hypothetical protein
MKKGPLKFEIVVLAIVASVAIVVLITTLSPTENIAGKAREIVWKLQETETGEAKYMEYQLTKLKTVSQELYQSAESLKTAAGDDTATISDGEKLQELSYATENYALDELYGQDALRVLKELDATTSDKELKKRVGREPAALRKVKGATSAEISDLNGLLASLSRIANARANEARYQNALQLLTPDQQEAFRELEHRYALYKKTLEMKYEEYELDEALLQEKMEAQEWTAWNAMALFAVEAKQEQLSLEVIIQEGREEIIAAIMPSLPRKAECRDFTTFATPLGGI